MRASNFHVKNLWGDLHCNIYNLLNKHPNAQGEILPDRPETGQLPLDTGEPK